MNSTSQTQKSLSVLLDEIEARANAATRGPWDFHGQSRTFAVSCVINGVHRPRIVNGDIDLLDGDEGHGGVISMSDAQFIASARSDVPRLVKALRYATKHWGHGVNAEVAAILTDSGGGATVPELNVEGAALGNPKP